MSDEEKAKEEKKERNGAGGEKGAGEVREGEKGGETLKHPGAAFKTPRFDLGYPFVLYFLCDQMLQIQSLTFCSLLLLLLHPLHRDAPAPLLVLQLTLLSLAQASIIAPHKAIVSLRVRFSDTVRDWLLSNF